MSLPVQCRTRSRRCKAEGVTRSLSAIYLADGLQASRISAWFSALRTARPCGSRCAEPVKSWQVTVDAFTRIVPHRARVGHDLPVAGVRHGNAVPGELKGVRVAPRKRRPKLKSRAGGDKPSRHPLARFSRPRRPMPLHVREFACGGCGLEPDRDANAARNILRRGIALAGRDVGPWVVPAHRRVFPNHMSPGVRGRMRERYAAEGFRSCM